MIKCSSDFVLCIMNAKFLNGHKDMQVQEGKYINTRISIDMKFYSHWQESI